MKTKIASRKIQNLQFLYFSKALYAKGYIERHREEQMVKGEERERENLNLGKK